MRFFGQELNACKNRPTPRRRGFLHEIAPFLIEAAAHRAENANEAWYRLLIRLLIQ